MHRVVFHLDESAGHKVEALLRSANHLLDDLGPEGLSVEIVAHSDGIVALCRQYHKAQAVTDLAGRGVHLAACHNTMTGRHLTPEDLLPMAEVVPSGVGELVRRQGEGWAYVHL